MSRIITHVFSPIGLIVALLALALAGPTFTHGTADWEKVFIPAAQRLRDGGDIYAYGLGYVYPPVTVLLAVPSTYLPPFVDRVWWWLWNTLAASVLICGSWRLAGGTFAWRPPTNELLAAILGTLTAIGFVFDVAVTRQIDLIVAALVIGGATLVMRHRPIAGGALIGLAAGMKCTAILFLPYYIWTGRWRAAVLIGVVAVGANLLPDALYPPADGQLRVVDWAQRLLPSVTDRNTDPGLWHAGIGFNHSLAGFINRMFTFEFHQIDGKWVDWPRSDRPPASTLKLAVIAAGLALMGVAATVGWIGRRTTTGETFEISMVLCLMLLMSPMSSKPHFCVLLLPAWTIARYALTTRHRVAIGIALLAAILGLIPNRDLVPKSFNNVALWYGTIPALTLLMFFGCAWLRAKVGTESEGNVTTDAPLPEQ